MRSFVMASSLVLAATLVTAFESDARACGGCFSPPTEQDSVVTDHRMILSVSSQQTTLYDQIHYTGAPSSFAWVLPINGQAKVGLSADVVFSALDSLTTTQVQQPPTNCPLPPSDCSRNASAGGFGVDGGAAAPPPGDVTIIRQEVVGPYETVQLSATTPNALNDWLTSHGYAIPPDTAPIIAAYQSEHYDFLALKLVPGASVQSMRPVRVTTAGGSPVLPLRMVTAGTGASVGITLWVLAEGRYEPQNFAKFQITSADLVWDWGSSSSNYKQLRAAKSDGKTWEIESSTGMSPDTVSNRIRFPFYGGGPPVSVDAGSDYLPVTVDGGVSETADQAREDDIATLFAGIAPASARVTRIRADMAHANLNVDLDLQPAADQSELASLRIPTQESGQPTCTIYNGCDVVGQGPRDEAQAAAANNGSGNSSFSCATTGPSGAGGPLALFALVGFAGFAFVRSRGRKS
jgi:MYXO-CTERM domain-containing protein